MDAVTQLNQIADQLDAGECVDWYRDTKGRYVVNHGAALYRLTASPTACGLRGRAKLLEKQIAAEKRRAARHGKIQRAAPAVTASWPWGWPEDELGELFRLRDKTPVLVNDGTPEGFYILRQPSKPVEGVVFGHVLAKGKKHFQAVHVATGRVAITRGSLAETKADFKKHAARVPDAVRNLDHNWQADALARFKQLEQEL